jgi:hypothetical protein
VLTKSLADQLNENIKKTPGWVPLLVACYLIIDWWFGDREVLGLSLKAHKELLVAGITAVLYAFGDALGKPLWRHLKPKSWLGAYQTQAYSALCLRDDIYRVSKLLAITAKRYDNWWPTKNEGAKFFRSLMLPSLVMEVVLLVDRLWLFGLAALVAVFAFLWAYIRLKASHIGDLYVISKNLTGDPQYQAVNLNEKVRLFFWNGELVSFPGPRRSIICELSVTPHKRAGH